MREVINVCSKRVLSHNPYQHYHFRHSNNFMFGWSTISVGVRVAVITLIWLGQAQAQVRGVYPLGMSATNSGVTPESGFTYSNLFLFYSRDQLKGPEGEILSRGNNSILMDLNTFVWVCKREILKGAKFSVSATLPFANNSLTSDSMGHISGGAGFADSFYQPFILGWNKNRTAVKLAYGFLAPTGKFNTNADDNVGSGYWTNTISSGQTIYLTKNKSTSVSAFQMFEFHGTQKGTDINPGDTLNIDYSLMQSIPLGDEISLQLGLVGYNQWQITDKNGPNITPEQAEAHYKVNALGVASNFISPRRKLSLGLKYFNEFANRSTFQGYSLQISASISF